MLPSGITPDNVQSVNISYNAATDVSTLSFNYLEYVYQGIDTSRYGMVTNDNFDTVTRETTVTSTTPVTTFSGQVSGGFRVDFGRFGKIDFQGAFGGSRGSGQTTTVNRITITSNGSKTVTPGNRTGNIGGTPEKPKTGGKPNKS